MVEYSRLTSSKTLYQSSFFTFIWTSMHHVTLLISGHCLEVDRAKAPLLILQVWFFPRRIKIRLESPSPHKFQRHLALGCQNLTFSSPHFPPCPSKPFCTNSAAEFRRPMPIILIGVLSLHLTMCSSSAPREFPAVTHGCLTLYHPAMTFSSRPTYGSCNLCVAQSFGPSSVSRTTRCAETPGPTLPLMSSIKLHSWPRILTRKYIPVRVLP